MIELATRAISRERIYQITGVQFLPFNTLYQLLALKQRNSPLLEVAETLLMMPDLIGWLLTGRRVGERTNASTTQLLNPRTGTWSLELCQSLGLPHLVLPPLIEPGSELGHLHTSVAQGTGISRPLIVLTPATHDTASTVAAIPVVDQPSITAPPDWCYLSSET